MKKKKIKVIATWIVVPLMAAIFVLDILTVALGNKYASQYEIIPLSDSVDCGKDRIHFLNMGNSDCILLESDSHFALIDSGEGNNNPRKREKNEGNSEKLTQYLQKVATDDRGFIHLDFILGTHYHYDHVGCFSDIINNKNVVIDRAYFKDFDPAVAKKYEITRWGLEDIYNDIISSLKARNIERVSDIPTEMQFYGFSLRLYNTVNGNDAVNRGENLASVGIKVTKGSFSAFLAADMTGSNGLEELVMNDVGHVDLLKIGHHGYYGSSSQKFLKCISPDFAIVTNQLGKVYPNVKWNLTMCAKIPFYATVDNDGLLVDVLSDGTCRLYSDIH